jgi:DNA-binding response OmpR family regulator
MEKIIVVNANVDEGRSLCAILERHNYCASQLHSLAELETAVRNEACGALILDLDSLPVDNLLIRNLCRHGRGLSIIGTSDRPFHPDLEASMRTHISACLSKPVDEDELIYWLKSIGKASAESKIFAPD